MSSPTSEWDSYWSGTSESASFVSSGYTPPELAAYWSQIFGRYANARTPVKILDIATGHGAVVEAILAALPEPQPEITCVDNSPSALKTITERFPMTQPCQADAASIPIEDGSFDLVTSQFGAEYAGTAALMEASRLVKQGGQLAMVLHLKESGIYADCKASADAIRRMVKVNFIGLADRFLQSAFVNASGGNPANYTAAKKALLPALTEMKAILEQYGEHVAGDTVFKLYNDVSNIHRRIGNFDRHEVHDWLTKMNAEMGAYIERMESMCQAALDEQQFSEFTGELLARNFTLDQSEKLALAGTPLPLAWVLTARRN